jgi:DNA-binding GntR family transcriptional regulator
MMTSFGNRPIPLYYQLESILRAKINSGEYGPNELLPTEKQLATSYKVSRVTVRQALSTLEKDSLIVRIAGKGSFISDSPKTIEQMKLSGTIEDVIAAGIKTTIKVIDFSFVHPPEKLIKILKLPKDSKALKIEHIRFLKKIPYSYAVNYLPPELGEKIGIKDITCGDALYNILERLCNIKIKHAHMTIEATVADARIANLLEIMTATPLLRMERTVFDIQDKPTNYVSVLYRSDMYRYTANLVRERGPLKHKWHHSND